MALTERYVTPSGAGAHDGTSEANAWTIAEYVSALSGAGGGAGYRANIKYDAGGYSTAGAATLPEGTTTSPHVVSGYLTTPGDLDDQPMLANGRLDQTNLPVITLGGLLTVGVSANAPVTLQNLIFTGSRAGAIVGDTSNDQWKAVKCRFVNTMNSASAIAVAHDDDYSFDDCEFECTSTTSHSRVVICDLYGKFSGCWFKGANCSSLLETAGAFVDRSIFTGPSGARGIYWDTAPAAARLFYAKQNTFVGIGSAIYMVDGAPSKFVFIESNQFSNCSAAVESAWSGGATPAVIRNNQVHDCTSSFVNMEYIDDNNSIVSDTNWADDFEDESTGDYRLVSSAPGYAYTSNLDTGALQHVDPSGGGGGGGMRLVGCGGLAGR